MKCPSARKLCLSALAVLTLSSSLTHAAPTISRTQIGAYDLATGGSHLYEIHFSPTPEGATVTTTRPDDGTFRQTSQLTVCVFPPQGNDNAGYMQLQVQEPVIMTANFAPLLRFVSGNNLNIVTRPLSDAGTRHIFLEQASNTIVVTDPTMISMTDAGCKA